MVHLAPICIAAGIAILPSAVRPAVILWDSKLLGKYAGNKDILKGLKEHRYDK